MNSLSTAEGAPALAGAPAAVPAHGSMPRAGGGEALVGQAAGGRSVIRHRAIGTAERSRPLTISAKKESPAASAFAWLLDSGIQDGSGDQDFDGGVNAWFDLKSNTYPFVYSEITGYAVNAFLFSHLVTGETSCLNAARRASDWLLRTRYRESGLIKTRLNHESYRQSYFDHWVFTFDQWVILYGLANLSEVTGEGVYLEQAERMAKFLLRNTLRTDGFFYPVFDVDKKKPFASQDKWSRQSGSFHAKALMALRKLYELTKNEEYRQVALKLGRKTISIQEKNGRFITQDNEQSTHLHPHLYSLEGLLSFGLAEQNEIFIHSAEKGLKWVLDRQEDDGTIPSFFKAGRFLSYVRVDVLAQALRVGAILLKKGFLQSHKSHLKRLRERLLSYQITEGPQKGGFFYGQEQDGTLHYHVNAWVTMFSAQALWLYDHIQSSDRSFDMSFFV